MMYGSVSQQIMAFAWNIFTFDGVIWLVKNCVDVICR